MINQRIPPSAARKPSRRSSTSATDPAGVALPTGRVSKSLGRPTALLAVYGLTGIALFTGVNTSDDLSVLERTRRARRERVYAISAHGAHSLVRLGSPDGPERPALRPRCVACVQRRVNKPARGWPRPGARPVRGWPRPARRRLAPARPRRADLPPRDPPDLGADRRADLVQVADHRVVGDGHDRRVRVRVDREDSLRRLAPTMCWIAPLIPQAM